MSSSSALKYNIHNKPSFIAKALAMFFFLAIAFLFVLLWGIGWVSLLCLLAYLSTAFYIVYSLPFLPFSSRLSESGEIEINQPIKVTGDISARSFYNGWVLLLCVEVNDALFVSDKHNKHKHNKPRKWFIVFHDSVTDSEYRLLARLINSTS